MTTSTPGTLLYDGDCGFCTATAATVRDRLRPAVPATVRPWHPDDERHYGITPAEANQEIHWIAAHGGIRGGADAVVAWWRTGSGIWPWLARLLGAPVMINLARLGYRLIAQNRHRLPGGTATCEVSR